MTINLESQKKSLKVSSKYKKSNKYKETIESLLKNSGITINGDNPWDIQVYNQDAYQKILSQGSLGLGESYMDGSWTCQSLEQFFEKLYLAKLNKKVKNPGFLWQVFKSKFFNQQSIKKSRQVAEKHYDIGNDLYEAMLGPTMQYTCAYWKEKNQSSLDQAQLDKMDLVCRKLKLNPGENVLELGCGFGSFAKFMAENYGVSVYAYNISKEQIKFAQENNRHTSVTFLKKDYRSSENEFKEEYFDKIVSVGLMEHVGPRNYKNFSRILYRLLKSDGIALVHTISKKLPTKNLDPWIKKYIFPNGHIPADSQLQKSYEGEFKVLDWHDLIHHYDPTLIAWQRNFEAAWPELEPNYGHRVNGQFKNMWNYYLLSCAGAFRANALKVTQVILSKSEKPNYQLVR